MKFVNDLVNRIPALAVCSKDIEKCIDILEGSHKTGGKLLLCGNGGSAADCEHISGELLKGFLSKRPLPACLSEKLADSSSGTLAAGKLQGGICAIPLPSLISAGTAFVNDVDAELVYAQLVVAMGKPSDALVCLSTSGNSKNVVMAARAAKAIGMSVVAFTGETDSILSSVADVCIKVPAKETYLIQELHLPVYHAVCAQMEADLFD